MMCPECTKEGKRSRVTLLFTVAAPDVPVRPTWDEDGMPVPPAVRPPSSLYKCTNGHEFSIDADES